MTELTSNQLPKRLTEQILSARIENIHKQQQILLVDKPAGWKVRYFELLHEQERLSNENVQTTDT